MIFSPSYFQMIESGDNRMECKFVTTREESLKRHSDPRFRGHKIFSEDLSISFLAKKQVRLNQSWLVGFTILELSKYIMQKLYYCVVKPAFNGEVTVLLSDTDSFVMRVPAGSLDECYEKLAPVMDFSNLDPSHPFFSPDRKNVPGFLKDELPGQPLTEVVAVRSKTYALKTAKGVNSKCKGVKKTAKDLIPFDAFLACVLGRDPIEHSITQFSLQAKSHVNRLIKSTRVAFSSFDDKRFLLCGVHSAPYGSKLIEWSHEHEKCYFCANPNVFV